MSMEEKNFVQRMSEILGDKVITEIPDSLLETFENLIEKNKKEKSDKFNNVSTICIKTDFFDNQYLEFCSYDGQRLCILQDGVNYGKLDYNRDDNHYGEKHELIVKTTSTFLSEFEKTYKTIRQRIYDRRIAMAQKLMKEGKNLIARGTVRIRTGTEIIDDENGKEDGDIDKAVKEGMKKVTSGQRTVYRGTTKIQRSREISEDTEKGYKATDISAELILERFLDSFEKQQKKKKIGEATYYIDGVEVDKDITRGGAPGPRSIGPTVPDEVKEEFELDKRLEGIKKLVDNNECIIINNGEFYAFSYDLSNNGNNEKGHIIIIEPKKDEGIATRVLYLSNDELAQLMVDSKGENPELEAKAKFAKKMLEDLGEMDKRGTTQHHHNYEKWLAIMNYYLTGNRQIDPEILAMIDDEDFTKLFPRPYLTKARKELIDKDTGER